MSANFLLCFSPHTVNDPLNSPHCCSEAAQSSKSHMNAFWDIKEAISFTNTFAFTMRCSFNVFFVCAPISSFCRERRRSEGTSLTLNTSHVKRAALWLQTVPPRQVVYRRLEGEPSLADRMAESSPADVGRLRSKGGCADLCWGAQGVKKDGDDGATISAEGGTVSHVFRHPVTGNVISSLRMIVFSQCGQW